MNETEIILDAWKKLEIFFSEVSVSYNLSFLTSHFCKHTNAKHLAKSVISFCTMEVPQLLYHDYLEIFSWISEKELRKNWICEVNLNF